MIHPPLVRLALPALATGGLLWLCHFPVGWGWLAWVALVPFLFLVRAPATGWRLYGATWLGGLAFFVPVLQWMRVADPRMYFTWIGLAIYCALYFPIGLGFLRILDRRTRLPLVLTVPLVWTALEFLRAHFGGGFAWYFLSHTQHDFLPIIQISDVTGAYGVTFLVALVNGLVFELIIVGIMRASRVSGGSSSDVLPPLTREARQVKVSFLAGQSITKIAMAVLLLCAAFAYGEYRLSQQSFTAGPTVALIQGNLEQGIKNDRDSSSEDKRNKAVESIKDHYDRLLKLAKPFHANLIVFPETSYAEDWTEFDPDFPFEKLSNEWKSVLSDAKEGSHAGIPFWQYLALLNFKENKAILKEAQTADANILFGLNAGIIDPDNRSHRFNSAVLVDQAGQPQGRYDKIHRVPFGEYVPFRDWLPAMNALAPYENDYSVRAGKDFTRFPLGKNHFGVVICFEDTDPILARQYVSDDQEPKVDFLVNISNDGWFKGASEHEEHLAISRFRAIECRRALVRSVNMGVSAIIDPNGRVLQPDVLKTIDDPDTGETRIWQLPKEKHAILDLPPSRWKEFKKLAGVLVAELPIDHRPSLYAQWGDWLPWSCWIVLVGSLLYGLIFPLSAKSRGPA
jgi:apolipoprotein N-acyltransferase